MKKIAFAFSLLIFFSCKKEKDKWITGTVVHNQGCFANSWVIRLDNRNHIKYPFLCNPADVSLSSWTLNCDNAIIIPNLPLSLRQPGTQIKFSHWLDKGLLCFSSSFAPHHLEVSDVSAK